MSEQQQQRRTVWLISSMTTITMTPMKMWRTSNDGCHHSGTCWSCSGQQQWTSALLLPERAATNNNLPHRSSWGWLFCVFVCVIFCVLFGGWLDCWPEQQISIHTSFTIFLMIDWYEFILFQITGPAHFFCHAGTHNLNSSSWHVCWEHLQLIFSWKHSMEILQQNQPYRTIYSKWKALCWWAHMQCKKADFSSNWWSLNQMLING